MTTFSTLNAAIRYLDQFSKTATRDSKGRFTKTEMAQVLNEKSIQGLIARMSTVAAEKAAFKMRGTNASELVRGLEDIIEKTALRNKSGEFENPEIRSMAGVLKTVTTLIEKNENNQQLTQVQLVTMLSGLQKAQAFVSKAQSGDSHYSREERLRRQLREKSQENPELELNTKNLTKILKGQNTTEEKRQRVETTELRNLMYSVLGPAGPLLKAVDDLWQETAGVRETLGKGLKNLRIGFMDGFRGLKKFFGLGGGGGSSALGSVGGALGTLGKFGLQAGAVALAGYVGWKIGEAINEILPESWKEKIGDAIGWLLDEAPKKLAKAVTDAADTAKEWFAGAVNWAETKWKGFKDFIDQNVDKAKDLGNAAVQVAKSAAQVATQAAVNTRNTAANAAVSVGKAMEATKVPGVAQAGAGLAKMAGKLVAPSANVQSAINDGSRVSGVSQPYMMAMARQESSFNPSAKASTSSASGLYQFIDSTWKSMVGKYGKQFGIGMGDRFDARANAIMAGLFAKENKEFLAKKLGRDPTDAELYMAHFMGAAGAANFIKKKETDGDRSAAALYPREAKANPGIYYDNSNRPRTVNEVYSLLDRKITPYAQQYAQSATTPVKVAATPPQQQSIMHRQTASNSGFSGSTPSGAQRNVSDLPMYSNDTGLLLVNTSILN